MFNHLYDLYDCECLMLAARTYNYECLMAIRGGVGASPGNNHLTSASIQTQIQTWIQKQIQTQKQTQIQIQIQKHKQYCGFLYDNQGGLGVTLGNGHLVPVAQYNTCHDT